MFNYQIYSDNQGTITIIGVIVYVIFAITYGQIFGRAGIPKWMAWIPFVNFWKIYNLGGFGGYWLLIGIIPIIGSIPAAIVWWIAHFRISRNFGQSGAWVLLAIFFQLIWALIFGLATWVWRPLYPVRGSSTPPLSGDPAIA